MARWMAAVVDGDRPLCLCCDNEFTPAGTPPSAWTHRRWRFLTALCERCAGRSDDEIISAAYAHYRKMGLAGSTLQAGAAQYGGGCVVPAGV